MTIKHHLDDATLMSYAAGSLPEALGAVVATHLTLCAQCRGELTAMERLGAVTMDTLAPEPIVRSMSRTTEGSAPVGTDQRDHGLATIERSGDVPAPLSRLVGNDLSAIQWKRLGLGVWHVPLPLSEGAKGDLRLIKVGPGQAMPEHGHGGSELSLILQGSYIDEIGHFGVGDVADLDDAVEHRPMAHIEAGCICLIASEEKAKFKGIFARMLQPLIGI
jgi:putative transcriptional regulator